MSSATHHHGKGHSDDDGDGLFGQLGPEHLGIGGSIDRFIHLVDAVLAHPSNGFIAAGHNAATDAQSQLFWTYSAHGGLTVEARSGFLTTATGDGGFTLHVGTGGSWYLKFDGSDQVIGHRVDRDTDARPDRDDLPAKPPAPGSSLPEVDLAVKPAGTFYDASKDAPEVINGGMGFDTIQGGVGDYMIGGSGSLGGGLAGKGNCALYGNSPGSVLVDMQNGHGYGGTAEGNTLVNMNQLRGASGYSNVLIGSTSGTDLKSGGNNSILISTGGNGFEMRPDGSGNIMVSTAGADRIQFDPTHGWLLGDTGNTVFGFDPNRGVSLDLVKLLGSAGGGGVTIKEANGGTVTSNFFSPSAAGFDASTGTGNIDNYVRIDDRADGSHVFFSATGQVQSAGIEIVDLGLTHGLSVDTLYQNHNILV